MIHLRAYSYYSFLRGLDSPQALANAAVDCAMPAVALTDRNMLVGAVEFYDACRSQGISPIMGLEVELVPSRILVGQNAIQPSHPGSAAGITGSTSVLLYAMDETGWSNLCRISSLLNEGGAAAIGLDDLIINSHGLICLIGSPSDFLYDLLSDDPIIYERNIFSPLAESFSDRLYVEVLTVPAQTAQPDARRFLELVKLSKRFGCKCVPTAPVHYIHPENASLQRTVAAIRKNVPLDESHARQQSDRTAHFLNSEEFRVALAQYPVSDVSNLMAATLEIKERCNLKLPVGEPHYPTLNLPTGQFPDQILRALAEKGAARIYGEIDKPLQERLDHELEAIQKLNFATVFLIMEEIIRFAHEKGVPISSRGSAASSLVAHCLGITSPDPVRLNLYFERFLNPVRATPPDIDTDLCSRRRDMVINFVYERYGQNRVAMVATINRFRDRSALREVAKAYGMPPAQVNKLVSRLPHRWFGPPGPEVDANNPYEVVLEDPGNNQIRQICQDAAALIGKPHHLSIHPGGIIISPGNLTDLVPTQMAPKGIRITQFDLVSVERLGLLKMDLLGIRGLTVLGDVAESVYSRGFTASSSPLDVLEAIADRDAPTAEMVRHGQTIGCFQIESPGMRNTLREIQANCIDDVMVALALYRPGPLAGGLKAAFVERFRASTSNGPGRGGHSSKGQMLHPALSSILAETYGVILYQEQVLRIAYELAGFSLADADLLRRAMSHFDIDRQMQVLQEKFISGAFQNHQVPHQAAQKIWDLMAAFAGYGFPKAHAASYAQVAWRSAWCKQHHPAVFMAAVLANWGGYYSQRVYLSEARRMGINIRPPHINFSHHEFSVVYEQAEPVLYMGLGQVKALTTRTENRIIRGRPYGTFQDFLVRVDPRPIEAENLVKAGALEGLGAQPAMINSLSEKNWISRQPQLFSLDRLEKTSLPASDSGEWSTLEQMQAHIEVLGVSPTIHPLDLIKEKLLQLGTTTTIDALSLPGKHIRVVGMRQTWRRVRSGGKADTYFMTLEDLDGTIDVVIPGDVYRKFRFELSTPGPYLIEGVIEPSRQLSDPSLRASRVIRITQD